MICPIGKNTREVVINAFQSNNLISESQTTDGAFYVLKNDEFDKANTELSNRVFETYGIQNTFFTREGNIARFSSVFANLVDVKYAENPSGPVIPISVAGQRFTGDLTQARNELNKLNDKIVENLLSGRSLEDLLVERNRIVLGVARYKEENGMPVFDSAREEILLADIRNKLESLDIPEPDVIKLLSEYQKVMDVSKRLQEDFLGISGDNKAVTTLSFFEEVAEGSELHKPKAPWKPILSFNEAQKAFQKVYDRFKGNFDEHIATSIPTFRETQIKVGAAISKLLAAPKPNVVNNDLFSIRNRYIQSQGIESIDTVFSIVDDNLFQEIADYHSSVDDDRNNSVMLNSYEAFLNETRQQFDFLVAAGYDIRPYLGKGEPYGVDSAKVRKDLADNKRLYYLMSRSATGKSDEGESAENYIPFRETGVIIDGQPVLFNDMFRAVHDIFGHGMVANTFSTQGELNAYNTHRVMYSESAQKALFLETVVYNAYYAKNKEYAPRKIYDIPDSWIRSVNSKKLVYDIGGSEGGFVKAITEISGARTINLDPNPGMVRSFNREKVPGSEIIVEAFYEGFDEFQKHIPQEKADVVHESMTFQFIDSNRQAFVQEVKQNYLKEDGLFITEEKVIPFSEREWSYNEDNKDKNYKSRFYQANQISKKAEMILSGMLKNQTFASNYVAILKDNFQFVVEYWDAGNFRGYVASDNKEAIDKFLGNLGGKITSEFSSFNPEDGVPPPNPVEDEVQFSRSTSSKEVRNKTKSMVSPGNTVDSMLISTAKEKNKYAGPVSLEAIRTVSPTAVVNLGERLSETTLTKVKKLTKKEKEKDRIIKANESIEEAKETAKSNLKFLFNSVAEDVRVITETWYDGANVIAQKFAKRYGISVDQAAAVLASQSPQKPWYDNILIAQVIMDIWENRSYITLTKDAIAYYKSKSDLYPIQIAYIPTLEKSIGKPFEELSLYDQSIMVRYIFDNFYDRYGDIRTPNGFITSEKSSGIASLSSYKTTASGIEILIDPNTLSKNLGGSSKVRNFFNNINNPENPIEVTIDTHAMAAAYLRPFGASAAEVDFRAPNYAFFAEVYRESARDLGVLPRELQSIAWEAIRTLFTESQKKGAAANEVNKLWTQFRDKKITIEDVQAKTIEITNTDLNRPDWYRFRDRIFESGQDSDFIRELLRTGRYEQRLPGPRIQGGTTTTISAVGRRDQPDTFGTTTTTVETTRSLEPLEGVPNVPGIYGPDPSIVAVAEKYAADNGIPLMRQAEYVKVNVDLAKRIAQAYEDMKHDPQNPVVKEAYQNLINQTTAQYKALVDAGYKFWFMDLSNESDIEYAATPFNALRDLRTNKQMGVFATTDGYGSDGEDLNVADNPMLQQTGFMWPVGGLSGKMKPVLANDLFRAVHDAFGHGLEGAGFRARGEENAWQAHVRLFTGSAIAAITTETRGQNSWLNFGPYGDQNRKAKTEDTIFADQKTGLMPEWTWTEGMAADMIDPISEYSLTQPKIEDPGYHGGNLQEKSDYLTKQYYGDQPFTGYYFFSDFDRASSRGNRSQLPNDQVSVVDFSKYNTLKLTTVGYWNLKSSLKKIVSLLSKGNSMSDILSKYEFDISPGKLGSSALYNKLQEEASKIDAEYKKFSELIQTDFGRIERFETTMLKIAGYEGIDVRGLKEAAGLKSPDVSTEGSVIFDLKPGTYTTPNNQQMSFRNVELSMRRPDKNEIIFVPTEALLQRHAQDQPGFDILQKSNQIGDRVERAKRFIQNYIEDQRIIDFKTGERRDRYMAVFEPSIVDINDGKISFEDGRHRVLAAMELGITEVPIEVPKSKSKTINSLFTKSTQGVVSSPDLPNLTIPEGWENPC